MYVLFQGKQKAGQVAQSQLQRKVGGGESVSCASWHAIKKRESSLPEKFSDKHKNKNICWYFVLSTTWNQKQNF